MRDKAIILVGLLAVSACGRKGARSSDFDSATAAALATVPAWTRPANMPKVAHVMGFTLAHRLDRTGAAAGGPSAVFASTDSVLLSVRTEYATPGTIVAARLRQNNRTIDSVQAPVQPSDTTGIALTGLRFAPAHAKGVVQAEVFLGGKFAISQEFKIVP